MTPIAASRLERRSAIRADVDLMSLISLRVRRQRQKIIERAEGRFDLFDQHPACP